jgi:hypothetical protein
MSILETDLEYEQSRHAESALKAKRAAATVWNQMISKFLEDKQEKERLEAEAIAAAQAAAQAAARARRDKERERELRLQERMERMDENGEFMTGDLSVQSEEEHTSVTSSVSTTIKNALLDYPPLM